MHIAERVGCRVVLWRAGRTSRSREHLAPRGQLDMNLHADLELCRNDSVRTQLLQLAQVLFEEDPDWHNWCLQRLFATLGGALHASCLQASTQVSADDLLLDIFAAAIDVSIDADQRSGTIWITEETIGGNGVVEDVAFQLASDPQLFFQLVESALQPTERELIDSELSRFLALIDINQEIRIWSQNSVLPMGTMRSPGTTKKLRELCPNMESP